MSLSKAISGIQRKPPFLLIYGTPKVGKTSFASQAPSPIIMDIEQGSNLINVTRLIPKSFGELISDITELLTTNHSYKTVVIDSLDHLEPMVWKSVCSRQKHPVDSIEDVGGGFQKGYVEALREWNDLIFLLKRCRDEKGMMIICVAHVHTKTVKDPTQIADYDKFELKFHPKASALFKENADAIFFVRQELLIAGGDAKKKGKAVGDGKRILYTQGMPGYEAGNRYNLPAEMDLDFNQVYKLIVEDKKEADPKELASLKDQIAKKIELISDLKAKAGAAVAAAEAGDDANALKKILSRIEKTLEGKK